MIGEPRSFSLVGGVCSSTATCTSRSSEIPFPWAAIRGRTYRIDSLSARRGPSSFLSPPVPRSLNEAIPVVYRNPLPRFKNSLYTSGSYTVSIYMEVGMARVLMVMDLEAEACARAGQRGAP